MRHGARAYDRDNPDREPFMPLTERGRAEARAFGERLSVPSARLESSPVGRCRETAELVGRGAADSGVQVDENTIRPQLGAFFIRDLDAVVRACYDRGAESVFNGWVRGDATDASLMDPEEAFQQMMRPLVDALREPGGPILSTCVTHDANIYLARARCFQDDAERLGPVLYLDGLVLFHDGADLYAASPELKPRTVRLT